MQVQLTKGARPFKAHERTIASVLLKAMRLKLRDLEEMGMIEKEHSPYFSSPAFMVSKEKPGTYQMVWT